MSIRRMLPLAAALLLAGCATGYTYHHGTGDYYSGTPRVEYRYHTPHGVYRSYSPYYNPSWGYYGGYGYGGHPYWRDSRYYGPYYGHPYYGHPYYGPWVYYHGPYRPPHTPPPPGTGGPPPPRPLIERENRNDGIPWRTLDRIGRRPTALPPTTGGPQQPATQPLPGYRPPPSPTVTPPPAYTPPPPPSTKGTRLTPSERARSRYEPTSGD